MKVNTKSVPYLKSRPSDFNLKANSPDQFSFSLNGSCLKFQMFLVISVYFVWQLGEATKGSAAVATVFYGVTLNYLR